MRLLLGVLACGLCALQAAPITGQSPIDIVNAVPAMLPPLLFSYSNAANLTVTNTGSPDEEATIKALVDPGSVLFVSGVEYGLLQFHFHYESEHLLNGHQFEMELHLVHADGGGNLLVVGLWIEEGPHNALLDPILSAPPPPDFGVTGFNLAGLLPLDLTSYRYNGSLTTSPYTEGVQWVVLHQVLYLSEHQIDGFHDLFSVGAGGVGHNSRAPQPLGDRLVYTDIPEPASWSMIGIGVLALWAQRRRASL